MCTSLFWELGGVGDVGLPAEASPPLPSFFHDRTPRSASRIPIETTENYSISEGYDEVDEQIDVNAQLGLKSSLCE